MIKSIGDLENVLKVLRSQGVFLFKMDGVELRLGELPAEQIQHQLEQEPTEYPSQEELDRAVNLPVGGLDDPFLNYNESPLNEDPAT